MFKLGTLLFHLNTDFIETNIIVWMKQLSVVINSCLISKHGAVVCVVDNCCFLVFDDFQLLYVLWSKIIYMFSKWIFLIHSHGSLHKTRNAVSNAHKMIPPPPMFCMAKSLFCSGKPQNQSNEILNRRCRMASCSEQFPKVSWNSVQRS